MEAEQLQAIIKNKFKKIEPIQDRKILRAELTPNSKPAAIYYFDYNNDDISYDLKEYQENFLVNDYYNHPGYLQWNYYLVFLREDYSIDLKKKVEENDVYSRKYLFKPEEFKDFLVAEKTVTEVKKDIVIGWKEKLDAVDLDEVHSNSKYTEAIDRFLTNKVKKTITELKRSAHLEKNQLKIDFIQSIKLTENYRKYPELREFTFGKVNLISGVNGVGKTSLLEAIENVICGYTLRNEGEKDVANSIISYYNSDRKEDYFTPNDNGKYRERDFYWFNNDYSSRNYLSQSFNRYNFYNSDSAYKVKDYSGSESVLKYLAPFATGSEFGRIRERLAGFKDRLRPVLSAYHTELQKSKENIEQAEEILKVSKNQKRLQDYFNVFVESCKQNFWIKSIPNSFDELPQFENDLNESANLINNISRLLPTGILKNMKNWSDELMKIDIALKEIESLFATEAVLQKEKKEIDDLRRSLNIKTPIFQEAEKYFSNIESFNIEGISLQISKLKSQLDINRNLYNSFLKVDTTDLIDQKSKINLRYDEVSKEIAIAQNEKGEQEIKLKNLKGGLDQLQNLVLEIKAKGREYLTVNTQSLKCPLCESEFQTSNSLAEKINHAVSHIYESLQVEQSEKILQIVNLKIIKYEKEKTALTSLLTIAAQYYPSGGYSENIIENIITDFISLEKIIQQEEVELLSKNNYVSKLKRDGFDEDSLKEVKRKFKEYFPEFIFNSNGLDKYLELKRKLENDSRIMEEGDVKNTKAIIVCSNDFEKIAVETFGVKSDNLETQRKLLERKNICEQALAYFKQLLTYYSFKESEEISKINLKYENIKSSLSAAKDSQFQSEQKQVAEKLKLSAEKDKQQIEPKIERLEAALKTIDEIILNDTEEKVLKEFIELNSKSIEDIFFSIHTPHEFEKIKLNDSEISLTRKNDDNDNTITKLSSGQRSALALSIFLTLNRQLKKGPKILLFDDPVVYTDDLNVLSFLDYLRELVINEGKQIFFATANKKLAGLFEKKFSFLDDSDFKRILLNRN